ncbi:hypothetical protein FH609_011770 [Streptomyces sp. 3MP-14]|uniref:Uncharacterized protein n=1 Tax=Streptomyces mimosae TaxID=2586635 RepID=A0A5N6AFX5_9ACTN|nr:MULTISPECIES: hypothetical protein [Streptomyces]KAB8167072.1 hypothetical protein FH607_009220 [Streptomyces mimosae]KAB8177013.1 hypothetical protein FH609_011770 [Streptomyces sp. 3MP-14]
MDETAHDEWMPTGADPVTLPAGRWWDAVRAQLPLWAPVVERVRHQPGIRDRRAGTVTWLVPQGAAVWWVLPPGLDLLPAGAELLVPPAERLGPGGAVCWTTPPGPRQGIADPEALMAAIHAARVAEWMPARAATWLPVGRWWDALTAPRARAWSAASRLERAPAIASAEETLTWLVPAQSLDPADLPPGTTLRAEGRMEIPPATAARTGPYTSVPPLHWTIPPEDRAVIAPPNRLLRELRATLPRAAR